MRRTGDDAAAKAAWHRSLRLDPGQGTLRRELERLNGGDFDFAHKWDVDGVALAKDCGGQEKHPKALAVHVVDLAVLRVNEDGSHTTITHNVWKILNEQGREKYSNLTVPARPENILEVRAISPDGEVFLPIQARGSTFTLEGLQAGWLVETRYLDDNGATDRGFESGGWYFRDPNFGREADPVVLSRWVVDLPASMDPPLLLRNYGDPPAPIDPARRLALAERAFGLQLAQHALQLGALAPLEAEAAHEVAPALLVRSLLDGAQDLVAVRQAGAPFAGRPA